MWFLLQRALQAILVAVCVVTLIFFMLRLIPGDPVAAIAPTATPEVKAEIRAQLGLDRPLLEQYGAFLSNVARGDFGNSYFFQGNIVSLIFNALPYTMGLACGALLIALLISVPAGVISAIREDGIVDRIIVAICLLLQSAPPFWVGLMLISVVALRLGLPTVGYIGPTSLILPAFAMAVSLIPVFTQVVRTSLAANLHSDMVTAMRARGLSPGRIILLHCARLSCVPLLTVIGVQLGYLLGGTIVIEYIFNFPGLGLLTLNAVLRRDYPLLQVIVLVTSLIFLLVNLAIDMSYGLVDGRLRPKARASWRGRLLLPLMRRNAAGKGASS